MSTDGLPSDVFDWMVKAVQYQQNYFDVVCGHKWTEYKQSDYSILRRHIGFAIFGAPKENPNGTNGFTGYEERQLSYINDVFDAIIKQNNRKQVVCISFLYVCIKTEDLDATAPVISVHNYGSPSTNTIFIDPYAQAYENWQHYLQENRIPESVLCYPKNGVYSAVNGNVDVEFETLPAGKKSGKVLRSLGTFAATLCLAGSTVVDFLPLGLPFLIGPRKVLLSTCLYATGRGIQILVDHFTPGQPIGLDDSESRNYWLGIAAVLASEGVCAVASGRGSASKTVTLAEHITIKSVKHGLANTDEIVNKEGVTPYMFQLASAVLFFKNSVITADKAYSLMKAIPKNASQGSSGDVKSSTNQIFENSSGLSGIISEINKYVGPEAVQSICKWVCTRSWAFVTSLLQRYLDVHGYVREAVQRLWESWGEETSDVITKICKTFGLERWSDIVKIMCHCINETRSLTNCKTAEGMPEQRVTLESNDVEENSLQPYSNSGSGFISSGLSGIISKIYKYVGPETVENICSWVCNMLLTFAKRLLQSYGNEHGNGGEVRRVCDAWADESGAVITMICEAFGVGDWSPIAKIMWHYITNIKSLTNCETAEGVPEQSHVTTESNDDEENSLQVTPESNDDEENSLQVTPKSNDDEENSLDHDKARTALPSAEIFNPHAKFEDFQMCKTAADFCGQMKFICKFVKDEFEKEKLSYERTWKIVQEYNPNVNVKDFDQKYGISGNRNSHFLQQVFSRFKDEETEGFVWLKLAYDSQKDFMSTQKESAQIFFDGVTFYTFSNKAGLAHDGMLSEKQYHDIARELTKKHAGKENVAIIQRGSTAVIVVNLSEFVITVQSYIERGRFCGIAAMLHSPQ